MGVDGSQVVCSHTRDASGHVVGHGQCDRCDAIAVVVGLDLDQCSISGCDQVLHFGYGVSTAGRLRQYLRVDGSQVVCCDASDASGHVVGHGERCGRGSVAVVVGLDLDQSGVGCSDQRLHFGHSVSATGCLGQHLGVDSGQVACGNAGDASIGVVGHGQRCGCGAVAVVVGLDLDQCGVGCSDQSLHLGHGIGAAGCLGKDLRVDGSQVICADTSDASGHEVGHGERYGCAAIAVVIGLYLGQSGVGSRHQVLHFGHAVSTAGRLRQHLSVDCGQVVCGDAFDAGDHVVGHGQCEGCDAVAVVVGLDLGQGIGQRCDLRLDFGDSVRTARDQRQNFGVDRSQVVCGDASDAGVSIVGHGEG